MEAERAQDGREKGKRDGKWEGRKKGHKSKERCGSLDQAPRTWWCEKSKESVLILSLGLPLKFLI